MDVWEKLVELIKECEREYENFVNKTSFMTNKAEFVADYLISHGVTVQDVPDNNVGKWISVKDRTPTEADGTVWVCLADVFPYNVKEPYIDAKHDKRITEAFYSQFSKRWYKDGAVFPDGVVTHWMEKAQPPKGE